MHPERQHRRFRQHGTIIQLLAEPDWESRYRETCSYATSENSCFDKNLQFCFRKDLSLCALAVYP